MAEEDPDAGGSQQARAAAVAAAALRQAADLGRNLPSSLRLWSLAAGAPPEPRPEPVQANGPAGLAAVLEAATPAAERRVAGLHVTPGWLADHLVALALEAQAVDPHDVTVCDPACGGGAFLLAAGRALAARGVDPGHVVRRQLWGADIDPVGLAAAEADLAMWADEVPMAEHLVVGDALGDGPALWATAPPWGFTAVVGNPPFLNQLGRATVRSRDEVDALRARFGAAVRAYTDTAWLFLLLGVELSRPGGRVALVQPLSLVAARDASAVRTALGERADLRELWVERRPSFAASVQVCAPVLEVRDLGSRRGSSTDPEAAVVPPVDWAGRLADALGVPAVAGGTGSAAGRTLGDLAAVTAGFRDEYYGLVPLVREASPGRDPAGSPGSRPEPASSPGSAGPAGSEPASSVEPVGPGPELAGERPLVTVGALDWARSRWGERPTQFAKRRWTAPVVDLQRLDHDDGSPPARGGARWVARTNVPKVVVATQTRVVEAAVDEVGSWVPSVPALVVIPVNGAAGTGALWRLAAAVSAPSSTVWLLRRAPGTALSRGALKIAARDLGELPLPVDTGAWQEAAEALRAYARAPGPEPFEAYVGAAAAAYRADEAVVAWWRARVPIGFADDPGAG